MTVVVAEALSILGLALCIGAALALARRGWGAGAFFLAVYAFLYFVPAAYFAHRVGQGSPFVLDLGPGASLEPRVEPVAIGLCLLFALAFRIGYGARSPHGKITLEPRLVEVNGVAVAVPWLGVVVAGLLGFVGLLYYVEQYGGFAEAVAAAAYVRVGEGQDFQVGDSVFSYRFADVTFLALGFAAASRWRTRLAAVLLALPFLAYVLLLAMGKANLLALALVPFIHHSLAHRKGHLPAAVAAGTATALAVPLLQMFLHSDESVGPGSLWEQIAGFAAHPYVSATMALDHHSYLYFNDFLAGLGGTILPTSWLQAVAPWSSIEVNTDAFLHQFQRTIPPGPVAFGWYSAGVVGVVAWALILGFTCKLLDRLVDAARANTQALFALACLVFTMSNAVYHGVPEFVFYGHRSLACLLFLAVGFRAVACQAESHVPAHA